SRGDCGGRADRRKAGAAARGGAAARRSARARRRSDLGPVSTGVATTPLRPRHDHCHGTRVGDPRQPATRPIGAAIPLVRRLLGIGCEMDINSALAREIADLPPVGEPINAGEAAEMSTSEPDGVALEASALELSAGRSAVTQSIRVHGKSFFAGDTKHFVKGVTYGPFAIGTHRAPFPERDMVERDFALMGEAGINT